VKTGVDVRCALQCVLNSAVCAVRCVKTQQGAGAHAREPGDRVPSQVLAVSLGYNGLDRCGSSVVTDLSSFPDRLTAQYRSSCVGCAGLPYVGLLVMSDFSDVA
jgi:hypothetical protein